ncbi:DUF3429 domain-containing protein [Catenovulum sp. SM1970]|uniref:DUF3429 domain-containing protein n=1 Tax=Marinifaba aquimaris TaxID=2741323 RepID=UPI001572E158|nr:DUF3429 domain-containing protein [Marinifaba aquimaris]NTS77034.1 DUF3429 domain-containing protein [Marinifaba aquimaris]
MMYKRLGYLGLIPFVVLLLPIEFSFLPTDKSQVFLSYSSVILAFMAGTLWTRLLIFQARLSHQLYKSLLIVTNLIAIVAFLSLFLLPTAIALTVNLLLFLTLYLIEQHWVFVLELESEYLTMRKVLSFVVCTCHAFALMDLTLLS